MNQGHSEETLPFFNEHVSLMTVLFVFKQMIIALSVELMLTKMDNSLPWMILSLSTFNNT